MEPAQRWWEETERKEHRKLQEQMEHEIRKSERAVKEMLEGKSGCSTVLLWSSVPHIM